MDEKNEKRILSELEKISKLLALNLIKGLNQREQIETLSGAGFQPREIAEIIETTPNTVSVTLAKSRRLKKSTEI